MVYLIYKEKNKESIDYAEFYSDYQAKKYIEEYILFDELCKEKDKRNVAWMKIIDEDGSLITQRYYSNKEIIEEKET